MYKTKPITGRGQFHKIDDDYTHIFMELVAPSYAVRNELLRHIAIIEHQDTMHPTAPVTINGVKYASNP